jgi:hypothetical protein
MTGSTRTALITSGKNAAKIAFAAAVIAGCAVSLAGQAVADNCDPFLLSMTPQPVLSCLPPEQAPPPEPAQPAEGAPVLEPVDGVAGAPLPAEMPPPGDPVMPPLSDPSVPSP